MNRNLYEMFQRVSLNIILNLFCVPLQFFGLYGNGFGKPVTFQIGKKVVFFLRKSFKLCSSLSNACF